MAQQEKTAFYANAKKLFSLFQQRLVDILASRLDFSIENDFAKERFNTSSCSKKTWMIIKNWQGCTSSIEKQAFINKLKDWYPIELYIEVLEFEEQYEQILDYARNKCHTVSEHCTMSPKSRMRE